jgi:hypothetical protein
MRCSSVFIDSNKKLEEDWDKAKQGLNSVTHWAEEIVLFAAAHRASDLSAKT